MARTLKVYTSPQHLLAEITFHYDQVRPATAQVAPVLKQLFYLGRTGTSLETRGIVPGLLTVGPEKVPKVAGVAAGALSEYGLNSS
jgi:hypothetical protein